MALASLRYNPNSPPVDETKFGYIMYSGKATAYAQWHFRTTMKLEASSEDDRKKTIQSIVEALGGDAASSV